MNRLLLLAACGAALLVLAAPAAAKEVTRADICGASGCKAITDRDELRSLPTGGEKTAPAPPTAEYYTVTFSIEHGDRRDLLTRYYVPGSSLLAANLEFPQLTWFPVSGAAADAIRDAVDGIEPFPAPKRWPSGVETPSRIATASVAPNDGGSGVSARTLALAGTAAALCALAALTLVLARVRRRPARPADSPTTS